MGKIFRYCFIFLDPPYYGKYYSEVIKKLSSLDILNNNGVLIIETPEKIDLKELENEVFESVKESKYAKVFYFQKKEGYRLGNN